MDSGTLLRIAAFFDAGAEAVNFILAENLGKAVTLHTYYLPSYRSPHDPPPSHRACSLAAAMDILNEPTKAHRIQ